MSRELWPDELRAALAAVEALGEAQRNLPDGYWFDGKLSLRTEGMHLGHVFPNDCDTFCYEPSNGEEVES